jgi:hypothetical protein
MNNGNETRQIWHFILCQEQSAITKETALVAPAPN